jgi:hypothetical protein
MESRYPHPPLTGFAPNRSLLLFAHPGCIDEDLSLAVLAGIGGYAAGLLGGSVLIEAFSSNIHDKSMEAAMTGAFVVGPLMAAVAVIVVMIFRYRRAR